MRTNESNLKCNCQDVNTMSSLLMNRKPLLNNNSEYRQDQQCEHCLQEHDIKQQYKHRDCQTIIFKLRKKVHQSRAQYLLLQQQLSRLKSYTIQIEQSNQQLKSQLQNTLQELKNYDIQIQQYQKQSQSFSQQILLYEKQIHQCKNQLNQSKQFSQFLEQKIRSYQEKLKQSQLIIQNNNRFMYNLNQQNQLLIKIKTTLNQDNFKLKNSYEDILSNYQDKQSEINKLTYQIDFLVKQISLLQEIINYKRLSAISSGNLSNLNIKNLQMIKDRNLLLTNIDRNILGNMNMDRKQIGKDQILKNYSSNNLRDKQIEMQRYLINQQVNRKLLKYKKKALKYKQQRDQLLLQIQEAKQQIGNITLTNQFNID